MPFINITSKPFSFTRGKDATELSRLLTQAMMLGVMETFDNEGGTIRWQELKARTIKQRLRQGFGAGPILDRKHGKLGLRGGVVEDPQPDKAVVGVKAGIPYARIHQFGGIINRSARTGKIDLRTDAKGNLLHQEGYKNLAVFAKKRHKRKTERKFTAAAYTIRIPARPYLAFTRKMYRSLITTVIKFFEPGK